MGYSESQSRNDAIQGLEYTGNPFAYDSRFASTASLSDDDKELFDAVMSSSEQSKLSPIEDIRQIGATIARARNEEIAK